MSRGDGRCWYTSPCPAPPSRKLMPLQSRSYPASPLSTRTLGTARGANFPLPACMSVYLVSCMCGKPPCPTSHSAWPQRWASQEVSASSLLRCRAAASSQARAGLPRSWPPPSRPMRQRACASSSLRWMRCAGLAGSRHTTQCVRPAPAVPSTTVQFPRPTRRTKPPPQDPLPHVSVAWAQGDACELWPGPGSSVTAPAGHAQSQALVTYSSSSSSDNEGEKCEQDSRGAVASGTLKAAVGGWEAAVADISWTVREVAIRVGRHTKKRVQLPA